LLVFSSGPSRPNAAPPPETEALPLDALSNSSSPYLRAASEGPIRWQPWTSATFALARRLKRPMLIDVGAIWCHWCHVMDETTYANPEVARILNHEYVPVKVDADERPDIDALYQAAAARLTGASGWPLTCFTTPEGTLLYAAGYLPPQPRTGANETSAMIPVLRRIAASYRRDPSGVQRDAAALARRMSAEARPPSGPADTAVLRREIIGSLARSYDPEAGGFGRGSGPRFYNFPAIRLAIAYGFFHHGSYREMAVESLEKIARGGVFDQLGGGFHRYSTDSSWRVPHFEKMAYDQAMALIAYSEAYEMTRDSHLLSTIAAIRSYVNQTLLDPDTHAFFADQDADAFKGDDGTYYTWTVAEVEKALPPDVARAAIIYYGMADDPAIAPDGRIVLRRPFSNRELAKRMGIWTASAKAIQVRARGPLMNEREKRRVPPVHRVIMTDRNALMVSGYLAASDATGDRISRQAALAALDFLVSNLRDGHGGFCHVWSKGHGLVPGIVADQVYLLDALLDAYQASGDERWLHEARLLADTILGRFRTPAGLLANRIADPNQEPPGAQSVYDQPMPSVQAAAASAMRTLAEITSDRSYLRAAESLLAAAARVAPPVAGPSMGTLGLALEEASDGGATVAIVGNPKDPRTQSLAATALATYRPGKTVVYIDPSKSRGAPIPEAAKAMYEAAADRKAPLAFVCAAKACSKPLERSDELRRVLDDFQVTELAQSLALPSSESATTSP
jgi:uncharacterized protein YyaL (SSP411 family)